MIQKSINMGKVVFFFGIYNPLLNNFFYNSTSILTMRTRSTESIQCTMLYITLSYIYAKINCSYF